MDEVEGLFPVPLLRARSMFDQTVAALRDEIRSAFLRRNAQSDRLSRTEIVRPDTHPLYSRVAELAGPKVVAQRARTRRQPVPAHPC